MIGMEHTLLENYDMFRLDVGWCLLALGLGTCHLLLVILILPSSESGVELSLLYVTLS